MVSKKDLSYLIEQTVNVLNVGSDHRVLLTQERNKNESGYYARSIGQGYIKTVEESGVLPLGKRPYILKVERVEYEGNMPVLVGVLNMRQGRSFGKVEIQISEVATKEEGKWHKLG